MKFEKVILTTLSLILVFEAGAAPKKDAAKPAPPKTAAPKSSALTSDQIKSLLGKSLLKELYADLSYNSADTTATASNVEYRVKACERIDNYAGFENYAKKVPVQVSWEIKNGELDRTRDLGEQSFNSTEYSCASLAYLQVITGGVPKFENENDWKTADKILAELDALNEKAAIRKLGGLVTPAIYFYRAASAINQNDFSTAAKMFERSMALYTVFDQKDRERNRFCVTTQIYSGLSAAALSVMHQVGLGVAADPKKAIEYALVAEKGPFHFAQKTGGVFAASQAIIGKK